MAHLTGNFTTEAPLSPRVREALASAFENGWGDPKKLSQASHMARQLSRAAREEIAAAWSVEPTALEVVGEPHLLPYLSLAGYLQPETTLVTSSVDVGKIRAIARATPRHLQLGTDQDGAIQLEPLPESSLISLQAVNGETGIEQDLRLWSEHSARVVLDATRSLPTGDLYRNWRAVTLDAQSWNGPSGLGFLILNNATQYRYPLPHIAPIRVPESFSLPLLIASAVALSETISESTRIFDLRNQLRSHLAAIPGIRVIGGDFDTRYLSIVAAEISGEEILRALLKRSLLVDAGSACSPEDLSPSHVIAALGYPVEGHLRFTIHPTHQSRDIEALIHTFTEELALLRR